MKKWIVVALLAGSAMLAACTGEGPGVGATTWPNPPFTNTPTSTSTSAITAPLSAASPSSTPSPTTDPSWTQTPASVQPSPLGTASESSQTAAPSSSSPWPATFTPEQSQWAQEAWAAWDAYDNLTRQAYAAPSDAWSGELPTVAVGPELESAVSTVEGMAQASLVQTGFMSYELIDVTSAASDQVDLLLCSDMTEFAAHYVDGSQLPVDKSIPRTSVSVRVVRDSYAEMPWLVAEFRDQGTVC